MSRISKQSAAETAEKLLAAGRSQRVLDYDVQLGLARHHKWLRSGAPMPTWATASAGASAWVPVAIKAGLVTLVVTALGLAVWYARDRLQRPTAARPPVLGVEPGPPALASAQELAPDGPSPGPAPVLAPPSAQAPPDNPRAEPPVPRAARADTPEAEPRRWRRAQQETPPARAPALPRVAVAEVAPSRAASTGSPTTTKASATRPIKRATRAEVAAAPEGSSAARAAPPQASQSAQRTDDLAEMRQVAMAERLVERSPARALLLVRQGDVRFAGGYFQQERAFIAIMALIRLGRIDEARAGAARFAERFPTLPYGARILRALEAQQADAR